jgi:hypothetical protein
MLCPDCEEEGLKAGELCRGYAEQARAGVKDGAGGGLVAVECICASVIGLRTYLVKSRVTYRWR